jgi:hypothetical protein
MRCRPSTDTPLLIWGVFVAAAGCSAASSRLTSVSGEVVYGTDDRVDYFDLTDDAARTVLSRSMVALVSNETIEATNGDLSKAPSWGESDNLCPGEPFASQPAAAFCSGILVDWDLVLTADHCTRLYALSDVKVVFDYYEAAPGQLAVTPRSIYSIAEIVNEELDDEATVPRLDYAWLRLSEPVAPPRQPVSLYATAPPLQVGDPVISVGTPGGVPLKWDAGGTVEDTRSQYEDYFVTDSDNSAGSSGGGAFDASLALAGITARGGTDFMASAAGCNTTVDEPDDGGQEQFTYAFRALAGLCGSTGGANSSLCRADCGIPCSALPSAPASSAGCAVEGAASLRGRWWNVLLISLITIVCALRRPVGKWGWSPHATSLARPMSRDGSGVRRSTRGSLRSLDGCRSTTPSWLLHPSVGITRDISRAGYLGHLRETTEELRGRLPLIGDPRRGRRCR